MGIFGRSLADGDRLEVAGATVRLKVHARARRISLRLDRTKREIIARAIVANAVIRIIKRQALAVFTERTAFYCAQLGAKLPSVTMMDARARWGSCRPGLPGKPAAIRYSWRLALAPYEVADYVAAHECAHLLELNHGPKFWAHVSALVGDERPHRAWLRAEGSRLHAFGR